MERFYTLNEYILRFLTIKLDQNALEYFEKVKIAEANKAAEAELQEAAEKENDTNEDKGVPAETDEKDKTQGLE